MPLFEITLRRAQNARFKVKYNGYTTYYHVLAIDNETSVVAIHPKPISSKKKLDDAIDEDDEAIYEAKNSRKQINDMTRFFIAHPHTGEFMWVDAIETKYVNVIR